MYENKQVLLTVFTPAFNRAYTLPRTYESLKRQTCPCFDWLIVDDGSTDGTRALVENWMKEENPFRIRYIYKKNGGMHTAYNTAYANINTELNVCIDSDDCLARDAARIIAEEWARVRDRGYAGLIGLDADMDGRIIGTQLPTDIESTTYSEFYGHGGKGDKKFVFRTDVIKQYPPYPEFEGENYVGIACKFVQIDQDYRMGVVNQVLCNVEYQADGHSRSMFAQYLKNPKGFAYNRKIMMTYPISKKRLLMETAHYVSSSIIARNRAYIRESPRKLLTVLLTPAGCLLTAYIRIKARDQR